MIEYEVSNYWHLLNSGARQRCPAAQRMLCSSVPWSLTKRNLPFCSILGQQVCASAVLGSYTFLCGSVRGRSCKILETSPLKSSRYEGHSVGHHEIVAGVEPAYSEGAVKCTFHVVVVEASWAFAVDLLQRLEHWRFPQIPAGICFVQSQASARHGILAYEVARQNGSLNTIAAL